MLFKKAAIFTDIHFGYHRDSEIHNQDCLAFVEWFIEQAKAENCDLIMFLGDWFENKIRTENNTGWYSEEAISKLAQSGIRVLWLLGNHDIYFKNTRRVHALPFIEEYPAIELIDELHLEGDVLLVPWLVGDEFVRVPDMACKYVFGHLELPFFWMNQSILSPDLGGLHADHFYQCEAVFSGHYHKRQIKLNKHNIPITYIGNAFPINFNDLHDNDRGMMILEWDQLPQYRSWPGAPNFHRISVSELLNRIDMDQITFNERSVIECLNDLNIADEDALEIKETLKSRVFKMLPMKSESLIETVTEIEKEYASFDDLVVDHLRNLDTQGRYRIDLLIELFRQ